ncbi:hypothetical protein V5799_001889 [Amblyomma americanum]|uniref:Uncharacterized protein n=1 Tax=Amblyomma americanum TaxID=6943 RepID=A0AAQ4CYW9_AMBAM
MAVTDASENDPEFPDVATSSQALGYESQQSHYTEFTSNNSALVPAQGSLPSDFFITSQEDIEPSTNNLTPYDDQTIPPVVAAFPAAALAWDGASIAKAVTDASKNVPDFPDVASSSQALGYESQRSHYTGFTSNNSALVPVQGSLPSDFFITSQEDIEPSTNNLTPYDGQTIPPVVAAFPAAALSGDGTSIAMAVTDASKSVSEFPDVATSSQALGYEPQQCHYTGFTSNNSAHVPAQGSLPSDFFTTSQEDIEPSTNKLTPYDGQTIPPVVAAFPAAALSGDGTSIAMAVTDTSENDPEFPDVASSSQALGYESQQCHYTEFQSNNSALVPAQGSLPSDFFITSQEAIEPSTNNLTPYDDQTIPPVVADFPAAALSGDGESIAMAVTDASKNVPEFPDVATSSQALGYESQRSHYTGFTSNNSALVPVQGSLPSDFFITCQEDIQPSTNNVTPYDGQTIPPVVAAFPAAALSGDGTPIAMAVMDASKNDPEFPDVASSSQALGYESQQSHYTEFTSNNSALVPAQGSLPSDFFITSQEDIEPSTNNLTPYDAQPIPPVVAAFPAAALSGDGTSIAMAVTDASENDPEFPDVASSSQALGYEPQQCHYTGFTSNNSALVPAQGSLPSDFFTTSQEDIEPSTNNLTPYDGQTIPPVVAAFPAAALSGDGTSIAMAVTDASENVPEFPDVASSSQALGYESQRSHYTGFTSNNSALVPVQGSLPSDFFITSQEDIEPSTNNLTPYDDQIPPVVAAFPAAALTWDGASIAMAVTDASKNVSEFADVASSSQALGYQSQQCHYTGFTSNNSALVPAQGSLPSDFFTTSQEDIEPSTNNLTPYDGQTIPPVVAAFPAAALSGDGTSIAMAVTDASENDPEFPDVASSSQALGYESQQSHYTEFTTNNSALVPAQGSLPSDFFITSQEAIEPSTNNLTPYDDQTIPPVVADFPAAALSGDGESIAIAVTDASKNVPEFPDVATSSQALGYESQRSHYTGFTSNNSALVPVQGPLPSDFFITSQEAIEPSTNNLTPYDDQTIPPVVADFPAAALSGDGESIAIAVTDASKNVPEFPDVSTSSQALGYESQRSHYTGFTSNNSALVPVQGSLPSDFFITSQEDIEPLSNNLTPYDDQTIPPVVAAFPAAALAWDGASIAKAVTDASKNVPYFPDVASSSQALGYESQRSHYTGFTSNNSALVPVQGSLPSDFFITSQEDIQPSTNNVTPYDGQTIPPVVAAFPAAALSGDGTSIAMAVTDASKSVSEFPDVATSSQALGYEPQQCHYTGFTSNNSALVPAQGSLPSDFFTTSQEDIEPSTNNLTPYDGQTIPPVVAAFPAAALSGDGASIAMAVTDASENVPEFPDVASSSQALGYVSQRSHYTGFTSNNSALVPVQGSLPSDFFITSQEGIEPSTNNLTPYDDQIPPVVAAFPAAALTWDGASIAMAVTDASKNVPEFPDVATSSQALGYESQQSHYTGFTSNNSALVPVQGSLPSDFFITSQEDIQPSTNNVTPYDGQTIPPVVAAFPAAALSGDGTPIAMAVMDASKNVSEFADVASSSQALGYQSQQCHYTGFTSNNSALVPAQGSLPSDFFITSQEDIQPSTNNVTPYDGQTIPPVVAAFPAAALSGDGTSIAMAVTDASENVSEFADVASSSQALGYQSQQCHYTGFTSNNSALVPAQGSLPSDFFITSQEDIEPSTNNMTPYDGQTIPPVVAAFPAAALSGDGTSIAMAVTYASENDPQFPDVASSSQALGYESQQSHYTEFTSNNSAPDPAQGSLPSDFFITSQEDIEPSTNNLTPYDGQTIPPVVAAFPAAALSGDGTSIAMAVTDASENVPEFPDVASSSQALGYQSQQSHYTGFTSNNSALVPAQGSLPSDFFITSQEDIEPSTNNLKPYDGQTIPPVVAAFPAAALSGDGASIAMAVTDASENVPEFPNVASSSQALGYESQQCHYTGFTSNNSALVPVQGSLPSDFFITSREAIEPSTNNLTPYDDQAIPPVVAYFPAAALSGDGEFIAMAVTDASENVPEFPDVASSSQALGYVSQRSHYTGFTSNNSALVPVQGSLPSDFFITSQEGIEPSTNNLTPYDDQIPPVVAAFPAAALTWDGASIAMAVTDASKNVPEFPDVATSSQALGYESKRSHYTGFTSNNSALVPVQGSLPSDFFITSQEDIEPSTNNLTPYDGQTIPPVVAAFPAAALSGDGTSIAMAVTDASENDPEFPDVASSSQALGYESQQSHYTEFTTNNSALVPAQGSLPSDFFITSQEDIEPSTNNLTPYDGQTIPPVVAAFPAAALSGDGASIAMAVTDASENVSEFPDVATSSQALGYEPQQCHYTGFTSNNSALVPAQGSLPSDFFTTSQEDIEPSTNNLTPYDGQTIPPVVAAFPAAALSGDGTSIAMAVTDASENDPEFPDVASSSQALGYESQQSHYTEFTSNNSALVPAQGSLPSDFFITSQEDIEPSTNNLTPYDDQIPPVVAAFPAAALTWDGASIAMAVTDASKNDPEFPDVASSSQALGYESQQSHYTEFTSNNSALVPAQGSLPSDFFITSQEDIEPSTNNVTPYDGQTIPPVVAAFPAAALAWDGASIAKAVTDASKNVSEFADVASSSQALGYQSQQCHYTGFTSNNSALVPAQGSLPSDFFITSQEDIQPSTNNVTPYDDQIPPVVAAFPAAALTWDGASIAMAVTDASKNVPEFPDVASSSQALGYVSQRSHYTGFTSNNSALVPVQGSLPSDFFITSQEDIQPSTNNVTPYDGQTIPPVVAAFPAAALSGDGTPIAMAVMDASKNDPEFPDVATSSQALGYESQQSQYTEFTSNNSALVPAQGSLPSDFFITSQEDIEPSNNNLTPYDDQTIPPVVAAFPAEALAWDGASITKAVTDAYKNVSEFADVASSSQALGYQSQQCHYTGFTSNNSAHVPAQGSLPSDFFITSQEDIEPSTNNLTPYDGQTILPVVAAFPAAALSGDGTSIAMAVTYASKNDPQFPDVASSSQALGYESQQSHYTEFTSNNSALVPAQGSLPSDIFITSQEDIEPSTNNLTPYDGQTIPPVVAAFPAAALSGDGTSIAMAVTDASENDPEFPDVATSSQALGYESQQSHYTEFTSNNSALVPAQGSLPSDFFITSQEDIEPSTNNLTPYDGQTIPPVVAAFPAAALAWDGASIAKAVTDASKNVSEFPDVATSSQALGYEPQQCHYTGFTSNNSALVPAQGSLPSDFFTTSQEDIEPSTNNLTPYDGQTIPPVVAAFPAAALSGDGESIAVAVTDASENVPEFPDVASSSQALGYESQRSHYTGFTSNNSALVPVQGSLPSDFFITSQEDIQPSTINVTPYDGQTIPPVVAAFPAAALSGDGTSIAMAVTDASKNVPEFPDVASSSQALGYESQRSHYTGFTSNNSALVPVQGSLPSDFFITSQEDIQPSTINVTPYDGQTIPPVVAAFPAAALSGDGTSIAMAVTDASKNVSEFPDVASSSQALGYQLQQCHYTGFTSNNSALVPAQGSLPSDFFIPSQEDIEPSTNNVTPYDGQTIPPVVAAFPAAALSGDGTSIAMAVTDASKNVSEFPDVATSSQALGYESQQCHYTGFTSNNSALVPAQGSLPSDFFITSQGSTVPGRRLIITSTRVRVTAVSLQSSHPTTLHLFLLKVHCLQTSLSRVKVPEFSDVASLSQALGYESQQCHYTGFTSNNSALVPVQGSLPSDFFITSQEDIEPSTNKLTPYDGQTVPPVVAAFLAAALSGDGESIAMAVTDASENVPEFLDVASSSQALGYESQRSHYTGFTSNNSALVPVQGSLPSDFFITSQEDIEPSTNKLTPYDDQIPPVVAAFPAAALTWDGASIAMAVTDASKKVPEFPDVATSSQALGYESQRSHYTGFTSNNSALVPVQGSLPSEFFITSQEDIQPSTNNVTPYDGQTIPPVVAAFPAAALSGDGTSIAMAVMDASKNVSEFPDVTSSSQALGYESQKSHYTEFTSINSALVPAQGSLPSHFFITSQEDIQPSTNNVTPYDGQTIPPVVAAFPAAALSGDGTSIAMAVTDASENDPEFPDVASSSQALGYESQQSHYTEFTSNNSAVPAQEDIEPSTNNFTPYDDQTIPPVVAAFPAAALAWDGASIAKAVTDASKNVPEFPDVASSSQALGYESQRSHYTEFTSNNSAHVPAQGSLPSDFFITSQEDIEPSTNILTPYDNQTIPPVVAAFPAAALAWDGASIAKAVTDASKNVPEFPDVASSSQALGYESQRSHYTGFTSNNSALVPVQGSLPSDFFITSQEDIQPSTNNVTPYDGQTIPPVVAAFPAAALSGDGTSIAKAVTDASENDPEFPDVTSSSQALGYESQQSHYTEFTSNNSAVPAQGSLPSDFFITSQEDIEPSTNNFTPYDDQTIPPVVAAFPAAALAWDGASMAKAVTDASKNVPEFPDVASSSQALGYKSQRSHYTEFTSNNSAHVPAQGSLPSDFFITSQEDIKPSTNNLTPYDDQTIPPVVAAFPAAALAWDGASIAKAVTDASENDPEFPDVASSSQALGYESQRSHYTEFTSNNSAHVPAQGSLPSDFFITSQEDIEPSTNNLTPYDDQTIPPVVAAFPAAALAWDGASIAKAVTDASKNVPEFPDVASSSQALGYESQRSHYTGFTSNNSALVPVQGSLPSDFFITSQEDIQPSTNNVTPYDGQTIPPVVAAFPAAALSGDGTSIAKAVTDASENVGGLLLLCSPFKCLCGVLRLSQFPDVTSSSQALGYESQESHYAEFTSNNSALVPAQGSLPSDFFITSQEDIQPSTNNVTPYDGQTIPPVVAAFPAAALSGDGTSIAMAVTDASENDPEFPDVASSSQALGYESQQSHYTEFTSNNSAVPAQEDIEPSTNNFTPYDDQTIPPVVAAFPAAALAWDGASIAKAVTDASKNVPEFPDVASSSQALGYESQRSHYTEFTSNNSAHVPAQGSLPSDFFITSQEDIEPSTNILTPYDNQTIPPVVAAFPAAALAWDGASIAKAVTDASKNVPEFPDVASSSQALGYESQRSHYTGFTSNNSALVPVQGSLPSDFFITSQEDIQPSTNNVTPYDGQTIPPVVAAFPAAALSGDGTSIAKAVTDASENDPEFPDVTSSSQALGYESQQSHYTEFTSNNSAVPAQGSLPSDFFITSQEDIEPSTNNFTPYDDQTIPPVVAAFPAAALAWDGASMAKAVTDASKNVPEFPDVASSSQALGYKSQRSHYTEFTSNNSAHVPAQGSLPSDFFITSQEDIKPSTNNLTPYDDQTIPPVVAAFPAAALAWDGASIAKAVTDASENFLRYTFFCSQVSEFPDVTSSSQALGYESQESHYTEFTSNNSAVPAQGSLPSDFFITSQEEIEPSTNNFTPYDDQTILPVVAAFPAAALAWDGASIAKAVTDASKNVSEFPDVASSSQALGFQSSRTSPHHHALGYESQRSHYTGFTSNNSALVPVQGSLPSEFFITSQEDIQPSTNNVTPYDGQTIPPVVAAFPAAALSGDGTSIAMAVMDASKNVSEFPDVTSSSQALGYESQQSHYTEFTSNNSALVPAQGSLPSHFFITSQEFPDVASSSQALGHESQQSHYTEFTSNNSAVPAQGSLPSDFFITSQEDIEPSTNNFTPYVDQTIPPVVAAFPAAALAWDGASIAKAVTDASKNDPEFPDVASSSQALGYESQRSHYTEFTSNNSAHVPAQGSLPSDFFITSQEDIEPSTNNLTPYDDQTIPPVVAAFPAAALAWDGASIAKAVTDASKNVPEFPDVASSSQALGYESQRSHYTGFTSNNSALVPVQGSLPSDFFITSQEDIQPSTNNVTPYDGQTIPPVVAAFPAAALSGDGTSIAKAVTDASENVGGLLLLCSPFKCLCGVLRLSQFPDVTSSSQALGYESQESHYAEFTSNNSALVPAQGSLPSDFFITSQEDIQPSTNNVTPYDGQTIPPVVAAFPAAALSGDGTSIAMAVTDASENDPEFPDVTSSSQALGYESQQSHYTEFTSNNSAVPAQGSLPSDFFITSQDDTTCGRRLSCRRVSLGRRVHGQGGHGRV